VAGELWQRLRALPVTIETLRLERREQELPGGFRRATTIVVLGGDGAEGRGEDVTYEPEEHDRFAEAAPLDLSGRTTLEDLSGALGEATLFPQPPSQAAYVDYRRWAFESAALDLALHQAGRTLGDALGLPYRPVRFVVSTRLDAFAWLDVAPDLELKLDPEAGWTVELMERLAATGRVRVLDLKGHYRGTPVDQEPDPVLYRRCVELFPDAVIEDAALTQETRAALAGAEDRLSWDAPIHSVDDVLALEHPPRFLNIKPSRFGTVERLLDCLEHCRRERIVTYGGGQSELDIGRLQIQAVASLFYADAPNDVAPAVYNTVAPTAGLPGSPLPAPAPQGGIAG
jgi:hypothetical protein